MATLSKVFLPGKFQHRSLVGCSPWGCTESNTTERQSTTYTGMGRTTCPFSSQSRRVTCVPNREDYETQWQIGPWVVFHDEQLKVLYLWKKETKGIFNDQKNTLWWRLLLFTTQACHCSFKFLSLWGWLIIFLACNVFLIPKYWIFASLTKWV